MRNELPFTREAQSGHLLNKKWTTTTIRLDHDRGILYADSRNDFNFLRNRIAVAVVAIARLDSLFSHK
jgi:hypothetical protein